MNSITRETERAPDGSAVRQPDESLVHTTHHITLRPSYPDEDDDPASPPIPSTSQGTLYLTSLRLVWLSDVDSTLGYSIPWSAIGMHAVATDPSSQQSCIYAQVSGIWPDAAPPDDESLDDEGGPSVELWMVPSKDEGGELDALFQAMCTCAAMNPDDEEEGGEEEEEEGFYYNEDEVKEGAGPAGMAMLAKLDNLVNIELVNIDDHGEGEGDDRFRDEQEALRRKR